MGIATGAVSDKYNGVEDAAPVDLGRRGGKIGGAARAIALSKDRHNEIA